MMILQKNKTMCLGFPFGKSKLCDGVLGGMLGGSAISAIGSLIGGNQSAKAAKYAANKQYQIAQETNQANKEIAESNNKWNYQMFQEQNEYNSAVNQRARLEAAGLNPYLMMNGGSAGIAQSAPTADTSGTQVAPNIQEGLTQAGVAKGNAIASAASQIGNMVYGASLQQAQVDAAKADAHQKQSAAANMDIQNIYQAQILQAQMRKTLADAGVSEKTIDAITKQNFLTDMTMSDKIFAAGLQNRKTLSEIRVNNATERNIDTNTSKQVEETAKISIERQIDELNLHYLPKRFSAEMKQIASQIALNYANANLSQEQAITEGAKRLFIASQTHHVNLDNAYFTQAMSSMIADLNASFDLKRSEFQLNDKKRNTYDKYNTWDRINGSLSVGASLLNGVGGSASKALPFLLGL